MILFAILIVMAFGLVFIGGYILMKYNELGLFLTLGIIALTLLIIGGVIIGNEEETFCENNLGEYSSSNNLNLCSIQINEEYLVYKIIKVDGEFKLASFSRLGEDFK